MQVVFYAKFAGKTGVFSGNNIKIDKYKSLLLKFLKLGPYTVNSIVVDDMHEVRDELL